MRSIRRNVFETNSSSCHCLTVLKPKVYGELKDQKAVVHNKYHDAWENCDISVTYRSIDLIYISELHSIFLEELENELNDNNDVRKQLSMLDAFWSGLSDIFMEEIQKEDIFRKLVFFDNENPGFEVDVQQTPEGVDLYPTNIRDKSPMWIMAWVFRDLCFTLGLDYISFSKDFEDSDISIDDFELDENNCYSREHDISC